MIPIVPAALGGTVIIYRDNVSIPPMTVKIRCAAAYAHELVSRTALTPAAVLRFRYPSENWAPPARA